MEGGRFSREGSHFSREGGPRSESRGNDRFGGRGGADRRSGRDRRERESSDERRRSDGGHEHEWQRKSRSGQARKWGGVARRGLRQLYASSVYDEEYERRTKADPEWKPEVWEEEAPAPRPERAPRALKRRELPEDVNEQLEKFTSKERAQKLAQRLGTAVKAFERDRFRDARQILQPLAEEAPSSSAVRELYGMTLYRLGQWTAAIRELGAFAEQTGETTAHAMLADANRAMRRHDEVERLWNELKAASPDAATVMEGRIVMAGSLADQGKTVEAIELLVEAVKRSPKHVEDYHLRLWYALADLYEKSGELPRARDLFDRVARADPDFVDVVDRRMALG